MLIHKKTLLVSSTVLALTGGAAYAYVSATTVSGGGSVATSAVTTALSLRADATNVSPLAGDVEVPVLATNTSTAPLRIPAGTRVTVSWTPAAPSCPAGSFTATYTPPTTNIPVGAAQPAGKVVLHFDNKPDVEQSGCNGAAITLGFAPAV